MRRYSFILTALLLLSCLQPAMAQADRREVREGNRKFRRGQWQEAEIDYRKALLKDSLSMAAAYNLSSALYRQESLQEAEFALDKVAEVAATDTHAADYYYNKGDVHIAAKDWQKAVDALKESLLRDPGDLQAKENYIYAKKMLENEQNGGGGGGDQDQNQDQNQDQDQNQNQDNNQDNNQDQNQDQNQNQNQDQNNNQDQNQGQAPQQEPKISPQQAQQMLRAIQAKEKETQDKVEKEKAAALKSKQKDKNW